MGFDVAAASYDRFMGRYSRQLSRQMADLAGVLDGQRVLMPVLDQRMPSVIEKWPGDLFLKPQK